MRLVLSWLPTVAIVAAMVVVGVVIVAPELLPIPILRGDEQEAAGPEGDTSSAVADEETIDDGWYASHPAPEGPATRRVLPVVRLRSAEVAARIGLETVRSESRTVVDRVAGNAETAYDSHLFAEVTPRVRCVVREVNADHGDRFEAGRTMAVVDSAEVGSAKADYLAVRAMVDLAEETLRRTESLTAKDALPRANEVEARAQLNKSRADLLGARQKLRNLGLDDEDLARITKDRDTSSLLDVVAPIDGTVVELHAVVGEALEQNTVMFQLTDLSKLWVWIDIPESDYRLVEPGQPVTFEVPGLPGLEAEGEVEWVEASVNPGTRTVRVLGVLEDPDRQLRAGQYGRGTIVVGDPREAVVLPRSAVQDFAPGVGLVFLAREDGAYVPQRVEIRDLPEPGMVEVTWGLDADREVVSTGSFLLMTELRRDELVGD
ncbi:efflux RND transporter periplasmic adaptor subunit [Tautonia plasticadhaerens]|uniref:Cobalt-zinc-cadmium resistance protein CzcB n=1 Tax=Tautonia plasticadhaerens TaxID=2527974 RepID=A0A518GZI4_9BACT|nr:efflux RND transporter periplasmic adaptor subunit [Tautonia plasticadhaerens]QDV33972.1 Cobalt-zinc-cadmium resistance protein CzcB [Tautonia plasticadhaerens]